jgi:hypothetical protein
MERNNPLLYCPDAISQQIRRVIMQHMPFKFMVTACTALKRPVSNPQKNKILREISLYYPLEPDAGQILANARLDNRTVGAHGRRKQANRSTIFEESP